jgi:hypothetical protein
MKKIQKMKKYIILHKNNKNDSFCNRAAILILCTITAILTMNGKTSTVLAAITLKDFYVV